MENMIKPGLFIKSIPLRLSNGLGRVITRTWKPYSRLFLIGDIANWVLSEEVIELARISRRLGYNLANPRWENQAHHQSAFYVSQFVLIDGTLDRVSHRIAISYFHGRPGEGATQFDQVFEALEKNHDRIWRIQVSHSEMQVIALNTGIDPSKVHRIPIGINLNYFEPQTTISKQKAREKFGIPQSAVVIGSFQKDGVGWGEGMEPKLIKGPDIFLKVMEILKSKIPEIFVLLTGPARGYVKMGLEIIGVPYHHNYSDSYTEVSGFYHALDAYVVASRQEGGPKAVLESMASGVPLITTHVGQAMDLVKHGENGWMVEVEDVEGLAHWTEYAIKNQASLESIRINERNTAEANSYEAQLPLWKNFMEGFVEK